MTTVPQTSNKKSSFRSMTIFLQVHRILHNKTASSSVHLPDPKHLQKVRMWKGIWGNAPFVHASMRIQYVLKTEKSGNRIWTYLLELLAIMVSCWESASHIIFLVE
jgi:hypothetical protein